MGWRYFVITMGGISLIMFLIRFLLFTIYESPKYYMGKGRDEDAVRIVHEVARRNGKETTLTVDDLRACEGMAGVREEGTDAAAAIKRRMKSLSGNHVKALFATRKLAFSTTSIMFVWAFIGLAFPLYVSTPPFTANGRTPSSPTLSDPKERSSATPAQTSLTETPP
jgi:hypothetical protein